MKKILLGTTAIVAAGMIAAPSADAADKIKLSVGGYMNQWFGYTTADDDSKTIKALTTSPIPRSFHRYDDS